MPFVLKKLNRTEEDTNLAAVSEVEAGIRDFVRNDIAYLRRPAPSMLASTETRARAERRGHRQQRQLADPARRRDLARRDRKPDLRTRKPARPAACRRPARPARDLRLCPAQPGRDEIHPHDRRQRGAVEARRRRPAQQLTSFRNGPMDPVRKSRDFNPATCLAREVAFLGRNPFELAGPGPRPRAGLHAADRGQCYEERSAGQYRSHPAAEIAADGHHHDPVCRAGRGRGGAGADLEPLICRCGFRAMVTEF